MAGVAREDATVEAADSAREETETEVVETGSKGTATVTRSGEVGYCT